MKVILRRQAEDFVKGLYANKEYEVAVDNGFCYLIHDEHNILDAYPVGWFNIVEDNVAP